MFGKRLTIPSTLVLATLLAGAAPNAGSIVGRYACVTHGQPAWHFTSTNTPWGRWVLVHTSFPPQNGAPAIEARTFVGFDPVSARWNIVSLNADGSYYTRRSASHSLDGSQWTDQFPADGGSATIHATAHDYRFSFRSRDGKDTSLTVCTRL